MMTVCEYLTEGAAQLGLALSARQLDQFSKFADELCKWNSKINLTSIVLPAEIAVKHFLDSLTLVPYIERSDSLLDMGSGGGFPGIPLKIAVPELRIISVDAVEKKINFQRHLARSLALSGFTAIHDRVEKLSPDYNGAFTCIVSRAFADIAEFVKYALPLLAEDGEILAMKGKDGRKEALAASEELEKMGATVFSVHEFELPILKDHRALIVIRKM